MKRIFSLLLGVSFGVVGLSIVAAQASVLPSGAIAQSNGGTTKPALPPLANTEWLLEDLNGTGVIDNLQTTLRFDSTNQIGGRGGCNNYRAGAQLNGDRFTVKGIASTKKLCPPAVMDQETRYFQALQTAQRVSLDGSFLLVYSQDVKAPLRFTRLTAVKTNDNETNLVVYQSRRNAVRVFTHDGQTKMNVYDRQDRNFWLRGVSVKTTQTATGTQYTNEYGEARVVVSVPKAGKPVLSINGRVDR